MANLKAFPKGGIHSVENKTTAESPITNGNIPKIARIPMSMHTGAPAKVLVKPGDKVEEGQLIGEADGFISANVHSSVPGEVIAVEKGLTLTAKDVEFVVIKTGGAFKNWYEKRNDYTRLSGEELIQKIRDAGIVGLGGAAFPTHVKLSPPKDKTITTLIINGAECEPYLTIDHRLMVEKTDGIAEGIDIVRKILRPQKTYIGIEENKPDAIEALEQKFAGDKAVEVAVLQTRYPQGGEKQLIEAITRKQVPSGGLPMDIGIVVMNVGTIYAIYEAIVFNKPLIERGVTYTGDGVEHAGNYKFRIGMQFEQVFEEYGLPKDHKSLIAGGPMMGLEIPERQYPVTKGTSGILVLSKESNYKVKNYPCIRCARCCFVCPIGLEPTMLARLSDKLRVDEAVERGLMDCIECGSCSFVCPSLIPLVGLIRFGKGHYRRKQSKKAG